MSEFNLRYEPWIQASDDDRNVREFGLIELIERAHELVRLEGSNPLETISLYRLNVGLVHHLVGEISDAREWAEIFTRGRFDESTVRTYFERSDFSDGFDLFGTDRPFWQYPDLVNVDAKDGEERPVGIRSLLLDIAAGNTRTLFSHRSDSDDFALTPAEAARALVTAQYYAVGGLNKKHSTQFGYQQSYFHAPFVSGIVTLVIGENLFETLMLNVIPRRWRGPGLQQMDLGVPPWAESANEVTDTRRDATTSTTVPATYLELLLPRSRHVRLIPAPTSQHAAGVRNVHIAQGVAWNPSIEPWFVKRQEQKQGASPQPLPFNIDRAAWRDSAAYLGWESRDGKWSYLPPRNLAAYPDLRTVQSVRAIIPRTVRLAAYALANDKAKPLAWRQEPLALPVDALTSRAAVQEIDESLHVAEETSWALRSAIERFYREIHRNDDTGRDALPKRKAIGHDAPRLYWAELEGPFRRAVAGDWCHADFRGHCKSTAEQVFQEFGQTVAGSDVRLYPGLAQAQLRFAMAMKRIHDDPLGGKTEVKQT